MGLAHLKRLIDVHHFRIEMRELWIVFHCFIMLEAMSGPVFDTGPRSGRLYNCIPNYLTKFGGVEQEAEEERLLGHLSTSQSRPLEENELH